MTSLWHPFSDMAAVERDGELLLARGEGAEVWDGDGRRYLDATAGLWFTNVGHGRTRIAEAVAEQLSRLAAYSTFGDLAPDVTVRLADRLEQIAPVPDSKVFLTSGGSDSIDTAAKMARRYWTETGRPEKRWLIGRANGYHGSHYAGTAVGGVGPNKEGLGSPLVAEAATIGWDDPEDLRATLERLGPENVAAFFCEPVIGAGGVYPPPEGYLMEVRKICGEYDVLFVADEVITGYGRIGGAWFASTRFDLQPDLVATAKGLTSGYVPMGAVLVAPRVWEPFWTRPGTWFRHGYTYSGHAGAAAAALANLQILQEEELLDAAARLETLLHERLAPLAGHPAVREVRSGTGAVAAVALADPAQAPRAVSALRRLGISTRAVGGGGLQVSPAFVMTPEQVEELADGFGAALDTLG